MRLSSLAPQSLDESRRALHDDMAAVVAKHLEGFVSTLLNAYDVPVPGAE